MAMARFLLQQWPDFYYSKYSRQRGTIQTNDGDMTGIFVYLMGRGFINITETS